MWLRAWLAPFYANLLRLVALLLVAVIVREFFYVSRAFLRCFPDNFLGGEASVDCTVACAELWQSACELVAIGWGEVETSTRTLQSTRVWR